MNLELFFKHLNCEVFCSRYLVNLPQLRQLQPTQWKSCYFTARESMDKLELVHSSSSTSCYYCYTFYVTVFAMIGIFRFPFTVTLSTGTCDVFLDEQLRFTPMICRNVECSLTALSYYLNNLTIIFKIKLHGRTESCPLWNGFFWFRKSPI